MYNLLIVDDEVVVRTSLSTIVDWEKLGFTLVGSVSSGKAALSLMRGTPVDVLLTDIKMPIMDGIALMEQMQSHPQPPLVIVLSAYSDFELVRKAFKLGAVDYIVKSDITPEQIFVTMDGILAKLGERGARDRQPPRADRPDEILRGMALGTKEIDSAFFNGRYFVACLEIDDFNAQRQRFGTNIDAELTQPMLEFAGQISRIASGGVITSLSWTRYLLYYSGQADASAQQMLSICAQLQRVWNNYMNITVSVGISGAGEAHDQFPSLLQEAYDCVALKHMFGSGAALFRGDHAVSVLLDLRVRDDLSAPLVSALRNAHIPKLLEYQEKLSASLEEGTVADARGAALRLSLQTAAMLADEGIALWNVLESGQGRNLLPLIESLPTVQDIRGWLVGFIRRVADYLADSRVHEHMDVIKKAKSYIQNRYADPTLSLASVARHVGLNEKYFSSRFNHEMGIGFSAY
ncbi:MAG: response regulator, partial [Oscillospiraceae bacterium]|nr:response regulator [Oscillospiraceae bacterium]